MAQALTFAELQQSVAQLPAHQQLQLLAKVAAHLSNLSLDTLTH